MGPGFGGIERLGVVAHHIQVADGASDAHFVGLGEDLGGQDRVLGQTEHVFNVIRLAPIHGLSPTIMAIAADGDPCAWPVPADAPHQPAQMGANLPAVGRLAGTQDGEDAMAGVGIVDMDRHEAAFVMMGVE